MRAIWTGSIGFGLVNIPVKLYSASQDSRLNLDLLYKKDLSNIHFARVTESTGKEVNWSEIVKGYKLNDEYVVLEKEDFERARPEKTKIIEITDFVHQEEIDSIYYETPYYVEPEKGGERAYSLLLEALKSTNKVGVSTFVLRNKENLGILKSLDKVLLLNKIRFQEEIRDPGELNVPQKKLVKGRELEMAIALINQHSGRFDISSYKDTYTAELMKIIQAKAQGKMPKLKKIKTTPAKTEDLIAQLKASLEKKKTKVA